MRERESDDLDESIGRLALIGLLCSWCYYFFWTGVFIYLSFSWLGGRGGMSCGGS